MTPTLRPRDESPNEFNVPIYQRVLSKSVAQKTRKVMARVVTEGTGRRHARSDLYDIWGKTGTAQIALPNGRGYAPGAYNACFVGGAPVDRPQLVVACFIEHPNPAIGYYGGPVAGSCVKQIVERSLQYMGVPTKEQQAQDQVAQR